MTFWHSLKESVLELLFGRHQLDCWKREREQREACERAQREHHSLYKAMCGK